MQGLRTNYTLPMNELIMFDCHTVQYRCAMIIFMKQFNIISHHLSLQTAKTIICHGYCTCSQLRTNGFYPLRKCDTGGLSAHRLFSLSQSRGICRHCTMFKQWQISSNLISRISWYVWFYKSVFLPVHDPCTIYSHLIVFFSTFYYTFSLSWLSSPQSLFLPFFLIVGLSLYINTTCVRDVSSESPRNTVIQMIRTPWHRPLSVRINRVLL